MDLAPKGVAEAVLEVTADQALGLAVEANSCSSSRPPDIGGNCFLNQFPPI